MAKRARVTQQVFADAAANVGEFGSLQAGTKLLSKDPAAIQTTAYPQGWSDAIVSGQDLIALEELNGLHYVETYQLSYLFQEGIPEYDAGTIYFIGSIVKQTGTSRLYKSITDNNTGHALTDPTNWLFLLDLANPESTIFWCGAAGGSANVITLAPTNAPTAYAAGQIFIFIPSAPNTNALPTNVTVNVSTLGAVNLLKGANNGLAPNDLESSKIAFAIHDGTELQLINTPAFGHGKDVASAATLVLDGTSGDIANITGTTGVTAVTLKEGRFKICKFTGAVTLTYGASLLLNTNGGNYTTAANDVVYFYGLASGVVVGTIFPANGQSPVAVSLPTYAANTFVANATTGTATPTGVALSAMQLAGRGSTGNVAAIGIDFSLTMSGSILGVSQASTSQLGGAQTAAASDSTTGTSTTKVMTPAVMKNHKGVAKAWCNFAGATGSINASYNISSITRNSTGDYTAAFSNAMADANYVTAGMCLMFNSINPGVLSYKLSSTLSTSGFNFQTWEGAGGTIFDSTFATFTVDGN